LAAGEDACTITNGEDTGDGTIIDGDGGAAAAAAEAEALR
jgi:hypothetical protein